MLVLVLVVLAVPVLLIMALSPISGLKQRMGLLENDVARMRARHSRWLAMPRLLRHPSRATGRHGCCGRCWWLAR